MDLSSQPTEDCYSHTPELRYPTTCLGWANDTSPRQTPLTLWVSLVVHSGPGFHHLFPASLTLRKQSHRVGPSFTTLYVGHTTAFSFPFHHFQQVIPQVGVPSDDGQKSNRAFDAVNKPRGAGLSLSCLQACHIRVSTKHQDVV